MYTYPQHKWHDVQFCFEHICLLQSWRLGHRSYWWSKMRATLVWIPRSWCHFATFIEVKHPWWRENRKGISCYTCLLSSHFCFFAAYFASTFHFKTDCTSVPFAHVQLCGSHPGHKACWVCSLGPALFQWRAYFPVSRQWKQAVCYFMLYHLSLAFFVTLKS